jgi:O-methyltransferase
VSTPTSDSSSDRARRWVRGLRTRVSREAGLAGRVAELEKQMRVLRREVKAAKAAARGMQGSGIGTGTKVSDPVKVGPTAKADERIEALIASVRSENLTFLSPAGLRTLSACITDLEQSEIPGLVIECGTARGGSAIVMAASKSPDRGMKVFDVFGMIPPPTSRDGADIHRRYETIKSGAATGVGGDTYYGYREELLGEVTASFDAHGVATEANNVALVPGLFQDTLNLDEPVALAHLDGDWYESTIVCLQRLAPLLSPGGRFVIDDYDSWSGCKTAVDEYFADRDGFRFERRGKLHVVRI